MRKILIFVLTLVTVLPLLTGCFRLKDSYKPNPASDFEYEVDSDRNGIYINKYIGTSDFVVIPSKIEGMAVLSLKGMQDNSSVFISEGVFQDSNVKTVVISKNIESIGTGCFENCTELQEIIIPINSRLKRIDMGAFRSCAKLEHIDLSHTQTQRINMMAFMNCTKLKEVKFPKTLEAIEEHAFYQCTSLLEIKLPKNLKKAESGAFGECESLKSIVIPPNLNLNFLSEPLFYGLPNLEEIIFEKGRKEISGYSLIETTASNIKVTIPKKVEVFSSNVLFISRESSTTITFLGDAPTIQDGRIAWIDNATIYYDPNTDGWDSFEWKDRCTVIPK